jgi:hypothetical protein
MNFNTVAKAACVSKAYLYSQPGLRERIEALWQQTIEERVHERATPLPGKTDASRGLVILAKDCHIKELEAENQRLQQQLKVVQADRNATIGTGQATPYQVCANWATTEQVCTRGRFMARFHTGTG